MYQVYSPTRSFQTFINLVGDIGVTWDKFCEEDIICWECYIQPDNASPLIQLRFSLPGGSIPGDGVRKFITDELFIEQFLPKFTRTFNDLILGLLESDETKVKRLIYHSTSKSVLDKILIHLGIDDWKEIYKNISD